MNTNTDPVRALIAKWRSESTSDDQSSDYECGEHSARSECADELEAALAQQSAGVDEAMVERAVAAVMSAPTGISVEAYVRIVLEAALASAPVGVEDGPIDASDNAEYIEHCADRLERCGLRVTAGALRVIAHEHRSLSQQPEAPRYFAGGPEGHFYADDLSLARAIVRKSNHPDDWTITDLHDPTGEQPAAPSGKAVETPEEEGRRLAQDECIGLSDLYGTVSYENLEGERFDRLVAAFRDERWGGSSAIAAQQQGGAK